MKFLYLIVFCTSLSLAYAQTPPQGINYQAVAHDQSGNPLANQSANVRVGVLSGSASGVLEWEEVHNVTTNDYGLFDLIIGNGNSTGLGVQATFSGIQWGNASHFLKVEIDAGSGYELVGTMQFMSVPYAFHAETVNNADDADADPNNELINTVSFSNDTLYITDAGGTISTYVPTSGTDNQTLTYNAATQEISIENGNIVTIDVNDADADPNNELITNGTLNGTNLEITDAGGITTVDLSPLSSSNWTASGNNIFNNNTGNVGIGTTNPTTGLLEFNTVSGREIFFNSTGSNADIYSNGEMRIGTENTNYLHFATNNIFRMTFDFLGNAGIGTITPDATLDLVGTFQYEDGNQQAGYILTSDASGNASWQALTGTDAIHDADNDTKVQVEESPDEDLIRFDIAGTELMRLDLKTLHLSDGTSNTFVGVNAGTTNSTGIGINNTAFGFEAMNFNTSGFENTAFGSIALKNNTTGILNTAFGGAALHNTTTGNSNTALGRNALRDMTSSWSNTAVGESAGVQLLAGDNNTFIGTQSAESKTSGGNNVFLGAFTGYNNTTGNGNVFLGYNAGRNELGSNKLFIENSNSSTPLIYGDFANDSLKIFGTLSIGNAFTFPTSDGISGQVLTTDGLGNLNWSNSGDSDWISGTNVIYNVTDSVGIGTFSPRTKLEVYGSDNATNLYTFNGSPSTTLAIHNDDLTNSNYSSISFSARASNNGNYNAARIVAVNQNHTAGSMTSDLVFMTRDPGNISEAMRITGDNRIGIGTVNPSTDLHLNGNLRIQDGSEGGGHILTSDATGNTVWKPKSVSFFTGMEPANSNQTITQSVQTRLQFQSGTSSFASNDGAGYNAATYEFQAPVAGVYQLNVSMVFAGAPAGYFSMQMMHSSGNVISERTGFFNTIGQNWHSNNMNITVHLNAGETVWIEALNTNGNMSFYRGKSSFSGHLVYAD